MTELQKDIQEIKETMRTMQEQIETIGQQKLREIDAEMNDLLKKATRASEDDKKYIMRRVDYLNKKYTDLFLTLQLDISEEPNDDFDQLELYDENGMFIN